MKKIRILKNEAGSHVGVFIVSLILMLSIISFAAPNIVKSMPPKYIYGTASRCDSLSPDGASVLVKASGLPTESTTVSGGAWLVDVGPDTGTEWPVGTSFTVDISMSGWSGHDSGTVGTGHTNVGDVGLTPTSSLSASADASPKTALVGDSVSFTGGGSGGAPPYTYSWDFNGEASSSSQNPSHSFTSPGSKNCVLTVTDACSSTDTDSVTVQVNAALSGSGGGPYSGDVCGPVSFSGSASGGIPGYSYSWSFSDGGSASSQNPSHQFSSDGSYTATLTITDSDSPPNTYICSPAGVTISTATLVAGAGGSYSGDVCSAISFSGSASGGCTPYTYSWTFGDSGSGSGQNPSHQYTSDGSYTATVTVTSSDGQSDSDTASVSISTSTLSADAGGSYSGDACSAVGFSGSASGGCTPYTYSWSFSDGGSASGQNPSHLFSSDGSYTATVTVTSSDGQSDSDTASVSISTSTLSAGAGGSYSGDTCSPVSFSGSASGGCTPYTYSWTFGDGGTSSVKNPSHQYASDGSYTATVTVTSSDGQSDSDTASVSISTSTLNCDAGGPYSGNTNTPISFSASGSGGCSPYSYSWTFSEGGPASGQSVTHSFSSQGSHTATVTVISGDGQSCSDTASVNIIANPPEAHAHGPYEGIPGQDIHFSGSVTGGASPFTWRWEFGDGSFSTLEDPTHAYSSTGRYIVKLTVTDDFGQSDSDTVNAVITSADRPIADANGDYSGEVGEEVEFEGDVYGGTGPYTWYWEFGEGNTSDEQDPVFIYEEVGEYMVNLTVTDDNDYSDLDEVFCFIVAANDPPLKPETPYGEESGEFGTEYTYSTVTTDPDGDAIFYLWNWGDGSDSGWLGPSGNGAEATATHTWDDKGDYSIKVKARDPSGEESPWSDPLTVSMPHVRSFDLPVFIQWLWERFPFLEHFFAPFLFI